jgi:hypothetical protein
VDEIKHMSWDAKIWVDDECIRLHSIAIVQKFSFWERGVWMAFGVSLVRSLIQYVKKKIIDVQKFYIILCGDLYLQYL